MPHARYLLPLLVGCAAGPTPVGVSPIAPAQPAPAATPAAVASPAPAPGIYAPQDAVRDAMSSPLQYIGVGGWEGSTMGLACMYRNDSVFVVDEQCATPDEPTAITVHVLSPTRGHAQLYAEVGKPISTVKRDAYRTFAVSAHPARTSKQLDLAMPYANVLAYAAYGNEVAPRCTLYSNRPAPHCTKTAPFTPDAYATVARDFGANPPDAWYALVSQVVALRTQTHATLKPASLPLEQLRAWGTAWAHAKQVTVHYDSLPRVGNPDGWFAPMAALADGSVVVVGTASSGGSNAVPSLGRADASGKTLWWSTLANKGFRTHEGTTLFATADAVYVLATGYPNAAHHAVHRLIRVDHKGKVKWEWNGRPAKGHNAGAVPQVYRARWTANGTVELIGIIQLVPDGDVHAWTGEVDANGKQLRAEVGPVQADKGVSLQNG